MRSVSLVEKVELDFKGTVFQNAVCITDIDNDGVNELCVCNIDGDLSVFKGIEDSKACYKLTDLGTVVVLCGGCLLEDGENVLLTIDTEGCIHIIDAHSNSNTNNTSSNDAGKVNEETVHMTPTTNILRILHKGKIAPNSKVALLQDIDDNGMLELVIGYTDRFVRIYKWHMSDTSKEASSQQRDEHPEQRKATLSFTLSLGKENKVVPPSPKIDGNSLFHVKLPMAREAKYLNGRFVLHRQFSLLAQLGSLAICKTIEGLNQLIVSQPNGGYCILGVYGQGNVHSDIEESLSQLGSPASQQIETYPTFYPINTRSSRSSSHTDTQVIGGIKRDNKESGVLGLCTQDGYFMVLDNSMQCHANPVKNSSEHRWFTMSKLDATHNGNDEIALCSMNGMTYVIDKQRDIVSFNFNESVAVFLAGHYGLNANENSLSLCYVTLSGRIIVYYDFSITAMKVKCVHSALIEKLQQRQDLRYILEMFKLPDGTIDHQKLQGLVKKLWSEN